MIVEKVAVLRVPEPAPCQRHRPRGERRAQEPRKPSHASVRAHEQRNPNPAKESPQGNTAEGKLAQRPAPFAKGHSLGPECRFGPIVRSMDALLEGLREALGDPLLKLVNGELQFGLKWSDGSLRIQ